ncbi:MAG: hypothetical protein RSE64_05265, partial [Oscillospiraceae bacterium]
KCRGAHCASASPTAVYHRRVGLNEMLIYGRHTMTPRCGYGILLNLLADSLPQSPKNNKAF